MRELFIKNQQLLIEDQLDIDFNRMADGVRIIGKGLKKVGELTPEYDLEIFNDIADQVEGLGEAMKKLAKEKIGNPVEEDDYYDYDFEPVEF